MDVLAEQSEIEIEIEEKEKEEEREYPNGGYKAYQGYQDIGTEKEILEAKSISKAMGLDVKKQMYVRA